MTHRTLVSLLVWYVGWLGTFAVLEGLALLWHRLHLPGECPWFTLSRTSWHIERAWWPFQFVFLFGLCVLMVHIFSGGIVKLAVFGGARGRAVAKARLLSRPEPK